jgi:antitoxin (DNA-binding transcriptional repressor) of toxin-antitoxin stability system
MATIHIPEAEAARDFAALMAHVSAGSEVVIERDSHPVAIVRPPVAKPGRLLSESIALAEARGSSATIDEEFARNVEAAIAAHREPLDPPAWD